MKEKQELFSKTIFDKIDLVFFGDTLRSVALSIVFHTQ